MLSIFSGRMLVYVVNDSLVAAYGGILTEVNVTVNVKKIYIIICWIDLNSEKEKNQTIE